MNELVRTTICEYLGASYLLYLAFYVYGAYDKCGNLLATVEVH